MDTFLRFLYEFLFQFFSGIFSIFKGFGSGIKGMFNIKAYVKIINFYKDDFSGPEWLLVGLAILSIVFILAIVGLLIFFIVKMI